VLFQIYTENRDGSFAESEQSSVGVGRFFVSMKVSMTSVSSKGWPP